MSDKRIKAWVTKYALTDGIFVVDGKVSDGYLLYLGHESVLTSFAYDDDWHRTKEAALARAEQMRMKKIAALRKQLAKLEAMVFVAPDA